MNVIFMGTPDFSVPILRGLVEKGYNVKAVVTQPDRPKGRKKELTPPPVKSEALQHGLPVLQPETLKNEESVKEILELEPDLIITAAFGQILPEAILTAPTYGAVNVHASLLPKYRGGAPIHQAVIDGEPTTGITIMYMVKKLDAGDILTQRKIDIQKEDTTGSMHDKLSIAGRELLLETLPKLIRGDITPQPQNEKEATFARNIKRGREKINWSAAAEAVYNHIRGMHPWPVAYTVYEDKPIKIWQAEAVEETAAAAPGTIARLDENGIWTTAGDGRLVLLTEVQPSGKKRMAAADYLRGKHGLEEGKRFSYDG
ncbi:methionyl-tRNA formyltransferase [Alteribacillus sp. HJP-4]|uniref:methionyl-tRNA formyltransferase n=1 Tax=Alteribacillus sp. HJP-4 TaxID=2775394 RepID=UPI0035CCE384